MSGLREGLVVAVVMGVACAGARAADQTITFPTGTAAAPYTPANVTINPGERVTFNGAFANHPLVWDGGDFPTQGSGSSMAFTLSTPGVHTFHCAIHASMVGSVTVSGGTTPPPPGSPPPAGDRLATPDFTSSATQPQTGQVVTFTPTGFTDPDGSIARYEWDLDGNGSFETTGSSVTHHYDTPGSYAVALRYVDDRGQTSSATTHAITVVRGTGGASGGTGGSGAPTQPGAPGSSPSSPAGGTQGAGTSGDGARAPRLSVATRALAFHNNKASVKLTVKRAGALSLTLKRAGTTLATAHASATRAGTKTITLRLTRAGARALRRAHGRTHATLTVVARPKDGTAATTVRRTLSVKG
ncbi:MAG TPA: PKD domain-containing protein [Baekduia sp.]